MSNRILITGSAGFIGFHATKSLLEDNFDVYGIDNINDYYDVSLKKDRLRILQEYPNFKFCKIDISNLHLINTVDTSRNIFHHNNLFTIGIEEEYMLCHPKTGELINKADEIIHHLDGAFKPRYSYELILSEIEVNTSICKSVNEAIQEIAFLRNNTKGIGKKHGFKIPRI